MRDAVGAASCLHGLTPAWASLLRRAGLAAIITFAVFEAACCSQSMRAGIRSVSREQINAGYAPGMTCKQGKPLIALPQSFRHVLPYR